MLDGKWRVRFYESMVGRVTPCAPGDGCHEANEIYHVRGVQGTARPTFLRRRIFGWIMLDGKWRVRLHEVIITKGMS